MRRAIYEDDVIKLLDKGWKLGVYPVGSNIHALPSAQPYTADIQKIQDLEQAEIEKAFELGREDALSEIVRCKECKYMGIGNYCVYGTRLAWLTTNNDFCSRAERREE